MTGLVCEACGDEFEAKRSNAKFCSTKCRNRKHRQKRTAGKPAAPIVDSDVLEAVSFAASVTDATQAALDSCGRAETPLGQLALRLALRVDVGEESGSAMAALSKELRATLAAATANATTSGDLVDELRARREAKRLGA